MRLGKYIEVEKDDNFTLMKFIPAYKQIVVSDGGYIRNKKTGENCGQQIILCTMLVNGEIIKEEDCYEVVYNDQ